MRRQAVGVLVACVFLAACASAARAQNRAPETGVVEPWTEELPLLPGLRTQVDFWRKIFVTYSTEQVVIHDSLHLDRVYRVLDFTTLASRVSPVQLERQKRDTVDAEKDRIASALRAMARAREKGRSWKKVDRKLAGLFGGAASAHDLREAAERVRAQGGLRERFAAAIEIGHRYFPEMEAIFRREGVPVELTRLPLVESSFDVKAYSRVGAAGVWQFIRTTGRRYMRVDDVVDERRDPLLSTVAAARYLRENYEVLERWPLAVTAYNHGRAGIARAVAQVGSRDLVDIIRQYKGPTFGFASRNFYAEFLAALEVERNAETYFGPLDLQKPVRTARVTVPDYVPFQALASAAGMERTKLAEMNPALSQRVVSGDLRVPKGYRMLLPEKAAASFPARYAALPSGTKYARQKVYLVRHRVRPGETLWGIARRYGTSVGAIRQRNDMRRADVLRSGQMLVVPGGGQKSAHVRHRVRRGQTLSSIARKYNTSVRAIQRANGLRDANQVRVGQQLLIPTRS